MNTHTHAASTGSRGQGLARLWLAGICAIILATACTPPAIQDGLPGGDGAADRLTSAGSTDRQRRVDPNSWERLETTRQALPAIRGFFCWAVNRETTGIPLGSLTPTLIDPALQSLAAPTAATRFSRCDFYQVDLDLDEQPELVADAEFDGRHLCLGVFRLQEGVLRALDMRHSLYDPEGKNGVTFQDVNGDGQYEVVWQVAHPVGLMSQRVSTTVLSFNHERFEEVMAFDSRYRQSSTPEGVWGLDRRAELVREGDALVLATTEARLDATGNPLPGLTEATRSAVQWHGTGPWHVGPPEVVAAPTPGDFSALTVRYLEAYGAEAYAANQATLTRVQASGYSPQLGMGWERPAILRTREQHVAGSSGAWRHVRGDDEPSADEGIRREY